MDAKFDVALMVKVAQMYYNNNMKQEEIAKELQISRSLISMILTEAKDVGIVQINILDPQMNNDELSKQFESRFGLEKCIIVPTAVQDPNTLRKLVARRAVDVFNQELADQSNIGISWGRTCNEFIDHYTSVSAHKDISIVPLIGGSNQIAHYYQVNEMVRVFAEKVGGNPYFIYAPCLNSTVEEKLLFERSSNMQSILDKWANLDIVIAAVGSLPDFNSHERETYIGESEIFGILEKSEAVGDINARYFDKNGSFIENEYFDRMIGVSVDELRNARTTIGVAAGQEKVTAILGAMKTRIFNIFITDEQTAKSVLKAETQK